MERRDHAGVARFFCEEIALGEVRLEGSAVAHARVRRLQAGDAVQLIGGAGAVGTGRIEAMDRHAMVIHVNVVEQQPRPTLIEVVVPVADRDRMLLAAEKCAELQVSVWRPVCFARSRSVNPRGEGERFREKVRARMQGALEQSGSAWMPTMVAESELPEALAAVRGHERRLVMDARGAPMSSLLRGGPVALAVGPEGGLEDEELAAFERSGWLPAALGTSILRFETAVIASVAAARVAQLPSRSP